MSNNNYGTNYEFWKAEKWSLLLLVVGLYLSDTRFTSLILGISGLLFFIKLSHLRLVLDSEHLLLILSFFSIFFTKILVHHDTFYWSAHLCLTPLFMYPLGRYFMRRWQNEDNLLLLLLMLAASLGIVHIGITITDIMENGLVNPDRILGINADEDSQRAVTQRIVELSTCFCGFSILFYRPDSSFQRVAKIIFVALGILALLCGLHYVSRTCLFFFLITLVIGVFQNRNNNKKPTGKRIFGFMLVLLAIIVLVVGEQNIIMQLFQLYQDRGMRNDDIMSAGGRQDYWKQAITEMLNHPFGSKVGFFSHNLWLDIGVQFGIFPFIFLTWFSLSNIRKVIVILIRKQESALVRLCVCSFSVLFFASCFTEPIHVGAPNYLFFYIMFCGMVNAIYKRKPLLVE